MVKTTRTNGMKLLMAALAATCIIAAGRPATAALRMPAVFSENMVLQAGMPVPVWGWAAAGEKITVKFAGQEKSATAGADGKWALKLDTLKCSAKPEQMTVTGADGQAVNIANVLVGEVWLGSGQSNMEMHVSGCLDFDNVKADAKYPDIRMFTVKRLPSGVPMDDVTGTWVVCTPETVGNFSATLYFFGRKIHKDLGVPMGLIHSSWGGTRIEPWTPPCGFAAVAELKDISDKLAPTTASSKQPTKGQGNPTGLYNGMIHGLIPYALRGATWYQGESNGGEGESYFHKMRALIGGWRQLWGEGDLPFYFVQLATFKAPNDKPEGGDDWAKVLEAQALSLSIPNTGMAVLSDIGDAKNIHPKNKQDVGERLALWALAKDYGKKDLVYSGPIFKSAKIEGATMVISFDNVGSGLMVGKKDGLAPAQEVAGGELKGFAIKGDDGQWHWADAKIVGPTVVVSCKDVSKPVAVRFAFTTNRAHCNFYNKEGLPAVGFRTDTEWTPKGGK
jgi:sialate O-acetylesterase